MKKAQYSWIKTIYVKLNVLANNTNCNDDNSIGDIIDP